MSDEKITQIFNKIFSIIAEDELSPAEDLVVLTQLLTYMFQIIESIGVDKKTIEEAKKVVAKAILGDGSPL
jgi:hypothetical protein